VPERLPQQLEPGGNAESAANGATRHRRSTSPRNALSGRTIVTLSGRRCGLLCGRIERERGSGLLRGNQSAECAEQEDSGFLVTVAATGG
jgi:hypothetical protein